MRTQAAMPEALRPANAANEVRLVSHSRRSVVAMDNETTPTTDVQSVIGVTGESIVAVIARSVAVASRRYSSDADGILGAQSLR